MERVKDTTYISKNDLLSIAFILLCVIFPLILVANDIIAYAIIIGLFGFALIFIKPFWGLLFYLTFFLIRPQEFISVFASIPVPLEKIIAGILIVSMIIKTRSGNGPKFKLMPADTGLLIFMVATILTVPFSIWVPHSWERWLELLRLFIVYILMRQIVDTEQKLKILVVFVVLTSVFHAIGGISYYYQGIREVEMGIDRLRGMDSSYGDPNSIGATMVYTLPFLYCYIHKKTKLITKILAVLAAAVMLWCIILTGSRTSMGGVAFFVLLTMLFNKNKMRNIIITVLVFAGVWFIMPDQYKARYESTTDFSGQSSSAASARGRLEGLKNGIRMFSDRPLFGYGIGNFATASGMIYTGAWFESHSLPGQILGELGLVGVIGFIAWMYVLFKSLSQIKNRFKNDPDNIYNYKLSISQITHILLLFFLGLGGHNLYRYDWFIISALAIIMLNISRQADNIKEDRAIA